MSAPRIIGIVLVRNEDLFVRRAVTNIIGFCDEILLCDNGSTDGTASILREFSAKYPKISYHTLRHPSESHDLLQRFVGTRSWVFAVDGDEIYDPTLLKGFRLRLLAGEFDAFWRMKGNVLHCMELATDYSTASGYMSPPSRSMTKLYNFAVINAWNGKVLERLHGGEISFKEGFHDLLKNNFQESLGWEETPLRCLHFCFLRRSSQEAPAFREGHRENIQEIYGGGLVGKMRRLLNGILGRKGASSWKQDYYRRGKIETVDAAPFFQE
jgi:glycosyltransferase involved in cell wall biosynthesis